MIKFFRKIRQNLLSENKFSRYLLYAIGEIVLVVIGILLALQINNWNENRKDILLSKAILEEFKKDLVSDTLGINRITALLEGQTAYEAWALEKLNYQPHQNDSLRKVFFGPIYQEFIQDRTYRKLQNSVNPNLSGFLELQNQLTHYYTETKFLLDYNNQEEERFFNDYNTAKVLGKKLEIQITEFPMVNSEPQQIDILINYAKSIEGRNFVKSNYIRRKWMIRYFGKVKEQAIQLIDHIDALKESR